MAKTRQFKAYDLGRKKQHTIAAPPVKIHQPRLEPREWATATKAKSAAEIKSSKVSKKRGRFSKKSTTVRLAQKAIDILRCTASDEIECLHCGKTGDDQSCSSRCYREFRKQHFVADKIDIKGPGPMGYGAFTKPGVRIKKGQYLDEYIGDLLPIDRNNNSGNSLYKFEIPQTCVVDSERAGNWTRFINSHCRPNVKPWGDFIGKIHVIVFQALRDIGPEGEIVFDYGRKYFEKARFDCACDVIDTPHLPGQTGTTAKKGRSRR